MINSFVYSRDEKIRKEILLVFSKRMEKGLTLRVGVLNGFVHLTGTVDSNDTRSMAEEIAAKIRGVRGVVNRIEAPGSPDPARIIHLDLKTK
jgi:osmotically-inducible protein OsmY